MKLDLVVNDVVLVELKAAEGFHPSDFAQVITYLRVSGLGIGLLINFHVAHLRHGIRRFMPRLPDTEGASPPPGPAP